MTIDLANSIADVSLSSSSYEPWKVHIVDTGQHSMTGGRIKRIKSFLEGDTTFMMTYGDGVADIDIDALLKAHNKSNKLATVTATYPVARFGALDVEADGSVKDLRKSLQATAILSTAGILFSRLKCLI